PLPHGPHTKKNNVKRIFTIFATTLAFFGVIAAILVSCKKDEQIIGRTISKGVIGDEARAITNRLSAFYSKMKAEKNAAHGRSNAKTTSGGPYYSVDSLTYLMEGAFNMYAVFNNDSVEAETKTFFVSAPLTSGLVEETDATNAFWDTQDSLMELYNSINFADKELTFLEISSTIDGSNVIFKVTGAISNKWIFSWNPCPSTFGQDFASNHAFKPFSYTGVTVTIPYTSMTYTYGYGQCDIMSGVATSVTTASTAPDAMNALRRYGKRNYLGCNTDQACGYWVDVSTLQRFPFGVSSPTSPYNSAGYRGFPNDDIWNAYTFYVDGNTPYTTMDPDLVYKQWTTTPMMDFYLSYIPGIIANNIPSGKRFYDFNIEHLVCLCAPKKHTNSPYPTEYTMIDQYSYAVTSGIFVVGCGERIGISNM
ncbi:MAG: hypothetical protein ABI378_13600, partial [Chitinophagaceae bacterium]